MKHRVMRLDQSLDYNMGKRDLPDIASKGRRPEGEAIYLTGFAKTVLKGTFCISRNINLKY